MVYIDHEKVARINMEQSKKAIQKKEDLLKKLEQHSNKARSERIGLGIIPYGNGGIEYGLYGELPKERCLFDNGKLNRISNAITGGSDQPDRTIYQCSKCHLWYDLPLGEKEREEHRKQLRKIVF